MFAPPVRITFAVKYRSIFLRLLCTCRFFFHDELRALGTIPRAKFIQDNDV